MPSTKVRYTVSLVELLDVAVTFVAVVAVLTAPEKVPAVSVSVEGL